MSWSIVSNCMSEFPGRDKKDLWVILAVPALGQLGGRGRGSCDSYTGRLRKEASGFLWSEEVAGQMDSDNHQILPLANCSFPTVPLIALLTINRAFLHVQYYFLTISFPGMAIAIVKVGHSNFEPGSKGLTFFPMWAKEKQIDYSVEYRKVPNQSGTVLLLETNPCYYK